MSTAKTWVEDGLFEPEIIDSLPPCLVCGARDGCGTDSEGAGWNHYHRLDVATGQALAAEAADRAAAERGREVATGLYWGETIDLAEFEAAIFGTQSQATEPTVHVRGQVPFVGVDFGEQLPAWNGYHSIICVANCDGHPDGVDCDCLCHPYGAPPPRGVQS